MLGLVTGAAGFIGSHLCEKLIHEGYDIIGIDSFARYYPRDRKLANLASPRQSKHFTFVEGDLVSLNLSRLMKGVECVFHLAAQPGVRGSWGASFSDYVHDNIIATQRLLEASAERRDLSSFIYASSSSVYGDAEKLPIVEDQIPRPNSPYGITKLAAEHLCQVYFRNFEVPAVALRYFTVYGPRQRPDMAFNRFISKISRGIEIDVYGNGEQSRDFTYCDDIVSASFLALKAEPGSVFNVGASKPVKLSEAIEVIEKLVGKRARIIYKPTSAGDVKSTHSDISKARLEIGYSPRVTLKEGLESQVEWQLQSEMQPGLTLKA